MISCDIEKKLIEAEVPELDAAGKPLVDLEGKPVMKQGFIPGEEDNEINLSPVQERNRLSSIYNQKKVRSFYPGAIPALPKTFEEAIESGLQVSTGVDRFLTTVGDTGA